MRPVRTLAVPGAGRQEVVAYGGYYLRVLDLREPKSFGPFEPKGSKPGMECAGIAPSEKPRLVTE